MPSGRSQSYSHEEIADTLEQNRRPSTHNRTEHGTKKGPFEESEKDERNDLVEHCVKEMIFSWCISDGEEQ